MLARTEVLTATGPRAVYRARRDHGRSPRVPRDRKARPDRSSSRAVPRPSPRLSFVVPAGGTWCTRPGSTRSGSRCPEAVRPPKRARRPAPGPRLADLVLQARLLDGDQRPCPAWTAMRKGSRRPGRLSPPCPAARPLRRRPCSESPASRSQRPDRHKQSQRITPDGPTSPNKAASPHGHLGRSDAMPCLVSRSCPQSSPLPSRLGARRCFSQARGRFLRLDRCGAVHLPAGLGHSLAVAVSASCSLLRRSDRTRPCPRQADPIPGVGTSSPARRRRKRRPGPGPHSARTL